MKNEISSIHLHTVSRVHTDTVKYFALTVKVDTGWKTSNCKSVATMAGSFSLRKL